MAPKKKSLADVYPQWLDFEVLQTGTNVWTTEPIPLPVPRLRREVGDEVQLIEILKVDTLYVGCASGGMASPTGGSGRIYWRFVNVKLSEFLGLIQSQTG